MKKFAVTMVAGVLAVLFARGEILLQDGAPLGLTGYFGKDAPTGNRDMKVDAVTTNAVWGFSTNKWENASTSVVYVFPEAKGLVFPAWFEDYGFVARGGAFGVCNTSAPNEHRLQWKSLATGLFAGQEKIYLRTLLKVDAAAVPNSVSGDKYYGVGLTPLAVNNAMLNDGAAVWLALRKSGSSAPTIVLRTGSSTLANYELCAAVPGVTYLCVVEIAIGAGVGGVDRMQALAVPVEEYQVSMPFNETIGTGGFVEAAVVSAAAPVKYLSLGGPYQTSSGYGCVDEIVVATDLGEVVPVSLEVPVLDGVSVVNAESGFAASVLLRRGTADLYVYLDDGVGGEVIVNQSVEPATVGVEALVPLTGLAPDVTYAVTVLASNSFGIARSPAGTFYNGEMVLTKLNDASELSLKLGKVEVSRAVAGAEQLVYYSFVGQTAVEGVNFQTPSGMVIIPAGETSAVIDVLPLCDLTTDTDTTLSVVLADGTCLLGDFTEIDVTIENWTPATDANYWIASEVSDGLASTAANWSQGVPTSASKILLSDLSQIAMRWNAGVNGLSDTVASWEQDAGYTNIVTIPTLKGTAFTAFKVTGDVSLQGGMWRHTRDLSSTDKAAVGLFLQVGGNLTTGAGFTFDGFGYGYGSQKGPGGKAGQYTGISHGGEGGSRDGTESCNDSYLLPNDLGSSATIQESSSNVEKLAGGGLFNIQVAGVFLHDGVLTVNANGAGSYCSHSGGSIYITAQQLLGTGRISANGGGQSSNYGSGGGGRIAIVTGAQSFEALTNGFTGTLTAVSQKSSGGSDPARTVFGGNGTIYVASSGERTMYLYNSGLAASSKIGDKQMAAVVRANETWTLDRLILRDTGRVALATNGVLRLANCAAIESNGHANNLIRFSGGSLVFDDPKEALVADDFSIAVSGDSAFNAPVVLGTDRKLLLNAGTFVVEYLIVGTREVPKGVYTAEQLNAVTGVADLASGAGVVRVENWHEPTKMMLF